MLSLHPLMNYYYLPLTKQINSLTEEKVVRETVKFKMFVISPLDLKFLDHLHSLAEEIT